MSRLVVQHPQLSEAAVDAFRAVLGRAPTLHLPQLATWEPVTIDGEEVGGIADRIGVDAEIVPLSARLSDYRLITFDMDSTLITVECIDEIAEFAGRKAEVAAITEAAMRGEIADYKESLRRRVAMLAGVDAVLLERVYAERLKLNPGAEALIAACKAAGLKTLLVTGGFTFFTDRLKQRLGFDFTRSNVIEMADGKLTGRVTGPDGGEIVDADGKAQALRDACADLGCATDRAIAIGDGANDLKMMKLAGLSVAYRAKPIVRQQATYALNYTALDGVLNWFS